MLQKRRSIMPNVGQKSPNLIRDCLVPNSLKYFICENTRGYMNPSRLKSVEISAIIQQHKTSKDHSGKQALYTRADCKLPAHMVQRIKL